MAEDADISSDDEIDLDLLDEEELEHRRELAAVISNMKTQLSNYASDMRREQDITGLESLVRDVLDDTASAVADLSSSIRNRTENAPDKASGVASSMADTRTAVKNLLGETDAEDLTDHEHEEDGSCYENRSGLADDMKFLASMPELCGQYCVYLHASRILTPTHTCTTDAIAHWHTPCPRSPYPNFLLHPSHTLSVMPPPLLLAVPNQLPTSRVSESDNLICLHPLLLLPLTW
jgi:hypothetical protein